MYENEACRKGNFGQDRPVLKNLGTFDQVKNRVLSTGREWLFLTRSLLSEVFGTFYLTGPAGESKMEVKFRLFRR